MRPILDAVVELHHRLDEAQIPHAFGGAFALLWCTGDPRGTVDIDVNIFVPPSEVQRVLDALPDDIVPTDDAVAQLTGTGQCRVLFDRHPVDIFLDTTPFHDDLRLHVQHHQLADTNLPFLGCNDLAVFKAFFERRKDWADIEAMLRAGRIDVPYVVGLLSEYLGPDDHRVREFLAIHDEVSGT
jgi:hypothetical protein